MGDEELAAVGARAGIGHRQHAGFVVTRFSAAFVLEAVAWAAIADAVRAAALDHEIGDDAVEFQAVVEAALDQVDEIGDGHRRLVGEQFDADGAAVGVEDGDQSDMRGSIGQ